MVNLQSSINELQKEYNCNYARLEELERNYENTKKPRKREERIERKIRYEIEKDKLQARNQVIRESIKKLEEHKNLIDSLSHQYTITENIPSNITKVELEEQVSNIEKQLMIDYESLDIASMQNTMATHFYIIRTRVKRIVQVVYGSLLSALAAAVILLSIPGGILTSIFLKMVCVSLLSGGILTYAVQTVENRPYRKLFQKLNAELGKNALPVTRTDIRDILLSYNLKTFQNQIVKTKLELSKEKNILELKRKEEQNANEEDNEIKSVQTQTQEMTMSQYAVDENYGKQKCKQ